MSRPGAVVFYYRNGCHLCEELAALLLRGWPTLADEIEWRDVDERPEWAQRHGLQVPVLLLGDQIVCSLRPDSERLQKYFGTMANPI